LFTDGHKLVCKQLFTIELIHNNESSAMDNGSNPTISIHALAGIALCSSRTMKVRVIINTVALTSLLDSGSIDNFIGIDAAAHAGLQLTPCGNLRVTITNGDRVSSPGDCRDVSSTIDGEEFIIASYGLALGAYNMVLGVQWLESLVPILWDFGRHTMAFIHNGHRVL
jgi:hypothetical protein